MKNILIEIMRELFKKRRSVRGYKDVLVEEEKLKEILAAAESAPSAGGLKAREILMVKDKETREALAGAALGQDFVAEASVVLIFCAMPEHSARKYGQRGRELYAVQDATIAASFAWLEAINLGLSSCWVGAFDEEAVKQVLKLNESLRPIAILPIGYAK